MTPARLEPMASRSRVKHSTTGATALSGPMKVHYFERGRNQYGTFNQLPKTNDY